MPQPKPALRPGGGGGIGQLLRDKRAWIGIAAAAGIGLIVYVKRQQTTADAGTTVPGAATGVAGYVQGTADTSGSDIASYLGQMSQAIADQMAASNKTLADQISTGLAGLGSAAPSTTPSTTTGGTTPAARTVSVAKYTTTGAPWNSTLSGIAAHEGTTVAKLLSLNPNITNKNLLQVGQSVRVA